MKHNEIKIDYKPNELGRFGFDNINIDIKNTSYGALRYLSNLLKKEHNSEKDNECGFAHDAYVDLLNKLSNEIDSKIKRDDGC